MTRWTAYVRRHHWGMLACVVSMTGTTYAAGVLPARSVGTKQLKAGAVTPAKLSKKARLGLTGPPGPAGAAGVQGPAGPQGPPGPTDTQTFDGLDTVLETKETEVTLAADSGTSRHYFCSDNGVFLNASYTVEPTGPAPTVTRENQHRGLTLHYFNSDGAQGTTFTTRATIRCLVAAAA